MKNVHVKEPGPFFQQSALQSGRWFSLIGGSYGSFWDVGLGTRFGVCILVTKTFILSNEIIDVSIPIDKHHEKLGKKR
jgi:hypothetical protein